MLDTAIVHLRRIALRAMIASFARPNRHVFVGGGQALWSVVVGVENAGGDKRGCQFFLACLWPRC